MITFDSLRNDLKMLGVSSGDLLFLRISYKAIGRVEGGPKTFVDALLDVVEMCIRDRVRTVLLSM